MKITTTIDTRKTIDRYDIEGFYCGEWSVECSEDTHAEARKTLKEYLEHQFDDINGKTSFITSEDAACLQNDERFIVTLWVWEADTDDDYNDDCPDCLAVAY